MLEVLADGGPHPTEALLVAGARAAELEGRAPHEIRRIHKRRVAQGAPEPDVTDPNLVRAACRGIAQNSLNLLQGRGRVSTTTDHNGLSISTATPEVIHAFDQFHASQGTERPTRPANLFGGYTENDGWACAPLRLQDQFHFRSVDEIPIAKLLRAMPTHVTLRREPDGLYRGTCKAGTGDQVTAKVKEWCAKKDLHQSDMRPEPNKWRRDLRDLPADWLNDLCAHYQQAARQFAVPFHSQILVHVPDLDDVQCLLNAWLLEAVTRYDPHLTSGGNYVPFSGYLKTVLRKEAADLARKANGRRAADLELHLARATSKFEQEHARRPTDAELATEMGVTEQEVRKRRLDVYTLRNMRNVSTLVVGPDEPEISIPTDDRVDAAIEGDETSSMLMLAVVHGCAWAGPIMRNMPATQTATQDSGTMLDLPVTDQPEQEDVSVNGHNLIGFASLHMEETLGYTRDQVAALYGVSTDTVTHAREAAVPHIKALLEYQGHS